jgi:hypothetical protein
MERLIPNTLYPLFLPTVSWFDLIVSIVYLHLIFGFVPDPKTLKPTTRVLILDLLALHMVRTSSKSESSTIISYHPGPEWKTTSAETLYSRVYLVGRSIYWQKIFQNSDDPTFVLLGTLWYALYAWDEALETLWEHIGELVRCVILWKYILGSSR